MVIYSELLALSANHVLGSSLTLVYAVVTALLVHLDQVLSCLKGLMVVRSRMVCDGACKSCDILMFFKAQNNTIMSQCLITHTHYADLQQT